MAYEPHTPADRATMLARLGIESVDALFEDIPASLRSSGLALSPGRSEQEVAAELKRLADTNSTSLVSFLGAGIYRHFIPPAVDAIVSRGEFLTAYTPYQPEVSQGTLQTIYEYQSLIAELTGLDVVSASHYDGATATAEAVLMAARVTGRSRILVSRGVHRHIREVIATYARGPRLTIEEIPLEAAGPTAGTTAPAGIERCLATGEPVAAVVVADPNFVGLLEPMPEVCASAHDAGALFVAVVEPVSLAVLEPPGAYGADIAAGEGQPLGIAPAFGGPYLGILACRESLMRQIPGRLIGMTSDVDGRRGFVMTMQAREQHIRREKASSNICSNEALCALSATVYLSLLGPRGLADVTLQGAAKAHELESALADFGVPRVHVAPYLNEFVVRVADAAGVHRRLLRHGVVAGLPLGPFEPDDPNLEDTLLVCATEVTTSEDIQMLARALGSELRSTVDRPQTELPGVGR